MEKEIDKTHCAENNKPANYQNAETQDEAYCPYAMKIKRFGNIFCIVNILVGAALTFFLINDEDLCIFALAAPLVTALNCAIHPFIIGFAYIVANHEIRFGEKYKKEL